MEDGRASFVVLYLLVAKRVDMVKHAVAVELFIHPHGMLTSFGVERSGNVRYRMQIEVIGV